MKRSDQPALSQEKQEVGTWMKNVCYGQLFAVVASAFSQGIRLNLLGVAHSWGVQLLICLPWCSGYSTLKAEFDKKIPLCTLTGTHCQVLWWACQNWRRHKLIRITTWLFRTPDWFVDIRRLMNDSEHLGIV